MVSVFSHTVHVSVQNPNITSWGDRQYGFFSLYISRHCCKQQGLRHDELVKIIYNKNKQYNIFIISIHLYFKAPKTQALRIIKTSYMVCYISFKECLLKRNHTKTSFNIIMKLAISIYFLWWYTGLIRPLRHSGRVYTSKNHIDTEKKILLESIEELKNNNTLVVFRKMKVKTHKKLYDLLKVTKGFRDRARNSGQIFWTHCPMLNPPYFTLAMVRNLLLSSSHSDVLFGNVGCSRRQRRLSSQSLPCLRSSREAAFLVTQPQLPQRQSTGWGSERPPSVLILNFHSVWV